LLSRFDVDKAEDTLAQQVFREAHDLRKYFMACVAHMIQLGSKKAEEGYLQFRNNYQGEEDHIPNI